MFRAFGLPGPRSATSLATPASRPEEGASFARARVGGRKGEERGHPHTRVRAAVSGLRYEQRRRDQGNAVTGRNVGPITREESHYLEPGSYALKWKSGECGSDNGPACWKKPRDGQIGEQDNSERPDMSRISAGIRAHLGLEWNRKQQLVSFSTGWGVL
jgi:hypothetical protein